MALPMPARGTGGGWELQLLLLPDPTHEPPKSPPHHPTLTSGTESHATGPPGRSPSPTWRPPAAHTRSVCTCGQTDTMSASCAGPKTPAAQRGGLGCSSGAPCPTRPWAEQLLGWPPRQAPPPPGSGRGRTLCAPQGARCPGQGAQPSLTEASSQALPTALGGLGWKESCPQLNSTRPWLHASSRDCGHGGTGARSCGRQPEWAATPGVLKELTMWSTRGPQGKLHP